MRAELSDNMSKIDVPAQSALPRKNACQAAVELMLDHLHLQIVLPSYPERQAQPKKD